MVKTISKSKIANLLLFLLFAVFPFGQILKLGIFNLFDLIIGVLAIFTIFSKPYFPKWYKYIAYFLIFGLFSWVFNAYLLSNPLIFKGLLYLIRIFAYSLLPIFILNNFKTKKTKSMVINSLLVVVMVVTIFGWIQYLLMPDTTNLKILGWDDHYFRLIGTFLDPTYTAIILVLGVVLAIYKKRNLLSLFLFTTLAFTYSRAGYLAMFVSILYFAFKKRSWKLFLIITFLFLTLISLLPKSTGGEGVNLTRTSTISARLANYKQGTQLFLKSPVIGFGFNNICPAKIKYGMENDSISHSCFGFDSSILFVLVSTGIVGLLLLGYSFLQISGNQLLVISFLAVFAHSFFSNSLFYPHVMAWLGILIGLGSEIKIKRS